MEIQNLVGFALPLVIDFINKRVADSKLRFVVSVLVCLVTGVLFHLDKLHKPEDLLVNSAIIFAEAQLIYKLYWEKSTPREKIFNIRSK